MDGHNIDSIDLAAVDIAKALLWHTEEIHKSGNVETLSGLTTVAAARLRDDLLALVNAPEPRVQRSR